MQFAQRRAVKAADPVFVEDVKADETALRPVVQGDFQREGFKQVPTLQRGEEPFAGAISCVEPPQLFGHVLKVRGRLPAFVENTHAFGITGAGVLHVDVDLRHAVFVAAASDQERLDRQGKRAVARVPLAVFKEQVFPVLEPEKRNGVERAGFLVLVEQDREIGLHLPELVRNGDARHHLVAKVGAWLHPDAQVAVGCGVENGVLAHAGHPAGLVACADFARSVSRYVRLVGSAAASWRARCSTCSVGSVFMAGNCGAFPPMP